jgi:hypothetical protein
MGFNVDRARPVHVESAKQARFPWACFALYFKIQQAIAD